MKAVKQTAGTHFTSSGYLIALALVLFSGTGLMAGLLTRQVAGALRGSESPTLAPADLTATAGATTPSAAGAFELQVAVTPNPVKAGQAVQVVVTAIAAHTSSPLGGVRCTLVQTSDSLPLATWPSPVTTDSTGHAQWSVDVPQTASGPYTVSLRGDGPSGYRFSWHVSLTVNS